MAKQQQKLLGVKDVQKIALGYVANRVSGGAISFDKTAPAKVGGKPVYAVEGKVKSSGAFLRVFKMQIHGYTGEIVAMKWEVPK
jgi:hypothetical protein